MSEPKKLLLFAATTGYQIRVFAGEAHKVGCTLTLATDRCHVLDDPWGDRAIPVRFDDPRASAEAIEGTYDAVAAVGDLPAIVAAYAAQRLEVPFHPVEAVLAARNKFDSRERFRAAGLGVPVYRRFPAAAVPVYSGPFPCVLKPLGLSASRGVIRANDPEEFQAAYRRIQALLRQPEIARLRDKTSASIQVESFIPGREFSLEGLLTGGRLHVLALFDKPDPLDGPYFEESIYVTPSREPEDTQRAIAGAVQRAVAALGLWHGPVHAEARVNQDGVWMLEIAPRPIGGLCARALRFEDGRPLEELILRHALGEDITGFRLQPGASGVYMLPVERAGIYRGVSGAAAARAVQGIEDVVITAKEGERLVPLPEGASYPGFLFARGPSPEAVEASLRAARRCLQFEIAAEMPVAQ